MNERPNYHSIERSAERGPGIASRTLAGFIFASRWLQAPLYLGLIIAQAVYVVLFFVELWHLIEKSVISGHFSETEVMLSVLALIDIVMIANLLIMVIIGGYETFVSRLDDLDQHPDQPEWLSHVNAGVLKVKLATALISISAIHLLKSFINADQMSEKALMWQVIIHMTFVVSAVAMAYTDKIMTSSLVMAKSSH